jgi:alkanesulfonate monooxygenase SsuD/methylene tetrahydromethanopterin reductase-like flavin-dependent oxidoreductase (luciferase family)
MDDVLDPAAKAMLAELLRYAIVGSPDTVRQGLTSFVARTGADELMVTAQIFDHAARLRSFEITAQVNDQGAAAA